MIEAVRRARSVRGAQNECIARVVRSLGGDDASARQAERIAVQIEEGAATGIQVQRVDHPVARQCLSDRHHRIIQRQRLAEHDLCAIGDLHNRRPRGKAQAVQHIADFHSCRGAHGEQRRSGKTGGIDGRQRHAEVVRGTTGIDSVVGIRRVTSIASRIELADAGGGRISGPFAIQDRPARLSGSVGDEVIVQGERCRDHEAAVAARLAVDATHVECGT